jgi:hypothetical protein
MSRTVYLWVMWLWGAVLLWSAPLASPAAPQPLIAPVAATAQVQAAIAPTSLAAGKEGYQTDSSAPLLVHAVDTLPEFNGRLTPRREGGERPLEPLDCVPPQRATDYLPDTRPLLAARFIRPPSLQQTGRVAPCQPRSPPFLLSDKHS